jgi:hypothetical protein
MLSEAKVAFFVIYIMKNINRKPKKEFLQWLYTIGQLADKATKPVFSRFCVFAFTEFCDRDHRDAFGDGDVRSYISCTT